MYWNNADRWKVIISGEEENTGTETNTDITNYFISADISSSFSVNTQRVPSQTVVGELTTINKSDNSLINSIELSVVPGDEIIITDAGGAGPRLYYQIDMDTKLLYISSSSLTVENYKLKITQAGVLIINIRNDKTFSIINVSSMKYKCLKIL